MGIKLIQKNETLIDFCAERCQVIVFIKIMGLWKSRGLNTSLPR